RVVRQENDAKPSAAQFAAQPKATQRGTGKGRLDRSRGGRSERRGFGGGAALRQGLAEQLHTGQAALQLQLHLRGDTRLAQRRGGNAGRQGLVVDGQPGGQGLLEGLCRFRLAFHG